MAQFSSARVVIVMGVSGCGKTEVGTRLAARLGGDFFDADGFHPPENIAKMSAGEPLTDADRAPWFDRMEREVIAPCPPGAVRVLACSALKKRYRDRLRAALPWPGVMRFVHLEGAYELIFSRMSARHDHFMREDMLRSQFAALEPPRPEEEPDVLALSIEPSVEVIAETAAAWLAGGG